ncbi:hypothetical protein BH11CYA1_BH11CYA1_15350 [soil metagenome]
MQSEEQGRHKAPRSRQNRALTRAIDMVSEEFIEKFVQTGIDDGPEKGAKAATPSVELHMRQIKEAREARESREAQEVESQSDKPECVGFASLLAKANTSNTPSAFARLLDDSPNKSQIEKDKANDPGAEQAGDISFKPGTETTVDGTVIRIKDAGKKKRGLYTSCMQKPNLSKVSQNHEKPQSVIDQQQSDVGMRIPSAEQIEAAAIEASRINAARAEARLQAQADTENQENTCCPLVKNVFQPITALWQKLKSWANSKAC